MTPSEGRAAVAAAAANMAAWHTACLAALSVESCREGATWYVRRPAPFIFLSAITLDGPQHTGEHERMARELAGSRPGGMGINDTWNRLDLAPLGFERHREQWFARTPGEAEESPGSGWAVERAETPAALAEFEQSQHRGFETPELADLGTFGVYAPGLLEDRAMHILAIRGPGGDVASSAMAYVAAGVVGIYSVATPPEHRRKGYGEAVTRAAQGVAPLPAVLQPSAMGEAMYRRLGFEPAGKVTNWFRR